MGLSKENIRLKVSNQITFEKGEEYYKAGKTKIRQVDQFWKGEVGIKANVEGSHENPYKITMLLKKNQIYEYTCTCPAHQKYNGMCKHCVAVALDYMRQSQSMQLPGVSTSVEIRNMMSSYASREVAEVLSNRESSKVSLVPKLLVSRTGVKVEFRIGRERLYVIKDLMEFVTALERGYCLEYGKKLEFTHNIGAFDEKSQPLVRLIQEIIWNYRDYHKRTHGNWAGTGQLVRELELNPINRDRFMGLFMNESLELEDHKGNKSKVMILQQDPNIKVVISKRGKDGVSVALDFITAAFLGEDYLYVHINNTFFKCSREYTHAMGIFIHSMINLSSPRDKEIEINFKDMPGFCGQILPKLQTCTEVELEDGIDVEDYKPHPLETELWLDSPGVNEITLKPVLRYGDYSFQAVSEEKAPREIYRDIPGELRVSETIKKYFPNRISDDCLIIRGDEERMFRFLEEGVTEFMEIGQVMVSESFGSFRILPSPRVSVGVSSNERWLDLTIDIGDMSREELQGLLVNFRKNRKFHRLKNGEFIRLDESGLSTAAELADGLHLSAVDLMKNDIRVPAFRALYLDQVLKDSQGVSFNRDSWFKSIVRGLKSVEDNDFEVPKPLISILRGYQKTGFRWLKTLDKYGLGGILADDMGLGKTIQMITLLLYEKQQNSDVRPSLIVCPASLVYNWESEIETFGFGLRSVVAVGTASERKELIELDAKDYDVLITSYDLLKRDIALYEKKEFQFQIIDEAQFIKNASTQSSKAVKRIMASRKFALTGTPIENSLSELWSIFDYLMPGFLYSYSYFKTELEAPIVKEGSEIALKRLRRMIGPFLLRRLKQDVLKDLPDKLENTIMSKLGEEQKKLYMANALELKRMLEEGSSSDFATGKLRILAELTKLRQICCHPGLFYENYEGESAKLETCMELILSGISGSHKILLFSQFTSMLGLIEKRLQAEKISYYKITGATSKEGRMSQVNEFNKDEVPIFLISLKAGGTGLNLVAADMVIHYDPWWNVAAQNQATDRAHRIGQKQVVSVYKLIARNTIEENILKLQESKKKLTDQVITEGAISLSTMTKEDLIEILG